jgi:DNA-binding transcriptional LysR family regulator
MELRHFRYFVVAAEEENFRRAADRLHVAQSALSRQIKDLETELGVQLFERQQRKVRLSEAGRVYLGEVRRILEDIQRANAQTRSIAAGLLGTLRLSLHNSVVRYPVVTQILHAFRAAHPAIELTMTQMYSPTQLEALQQRQIDAGFVLHSRLESDAGLQRIEIGTDRYVLAVPRQHRLARSARIHLSDLKDQPLLWVQRSINPTVYDRLMRECLAGGLSPHIGQHVVSQEAVPNLVAMGMGLGFVLSYSRAPGDEVVFREVEGFSVELYLDFLWREDNSSPSLAFLVEMVAGMTRDAGKRITVTRKKTKKTVAARRS